VAYLEAANTAVGLWVGWSCGNQTCVVDSPHSLDSKPNPRIRVDCCGALSQSDNQMTVQAPAARVAVITGSTSGIGSAASTWW